MKNFQLKNQKKNKTRKPSESVHKSDLPSLIRTIAMHVKGSLGSKQPPWLQLRFRSDWADA